MVETGVIFSPAKQEGGWRDFTQDQKYTKSLIKIKKRRRKERLAEKSYIFVDQSERKRKKGERERERGIGIPEFSPLLVE